MKSVLSARGVTWFHQRSLLLLLLGVALVVTSAPADSLADGCRWEAVDENGDGDIDENESQECGGDEIDSARDKCDEQSADQKKCHAEDDNTHQFPPNLHWTRPQDAQRRVIIRDSLAAGGTWQSRLQTVLDDWAVSNRFWFLRQQAATDAQTRLDCPMPTNYGRVRVCNHTDYVFQDPLAIGDFRVNHTAAGHIRQGFVRLRNDTAEGSRRPLMCQEIGHTLGLNHRVDVDAQGNPRSCMWQNADQAPNDPDEHDYDQLETQTHSHGGESLTGGVNGDLDTGGGVEDVCAPVCITTGAHGAGIYTTVVDVTDHGSCRRS